MYNEYFGLEESPFSIAPDPRYLYMSEQHREALAHMVYGFNSDGGFVLLTGEVGTGKTTVCRCLLNQIPDTTAIAFILNPKMSVQELLATICDDFGILYSPDSTSIKVFVDLINTFLLDAHAGGRKVVLIIDEAQNLSAEVLEQLRLLTNLETSQRKLLQIILIGQPELRQKLSRPELRQLSQRIIARYHLGVLSRKEVSAYVSHRLSIAGIQDPLFPHSTIRKLYRISGGVPRLINVVCDRALLGTYTQSKQLVTPSTLKKAASEVLGEVQSGVSRSHRKTAAWILSVCILIIVSAVLAATYYKDRPQDTVMIGTEKADSPAPVELKTLYWPDNQPMDRSSTMSFQELFRLWGIAFQPESDVSPCEQAEAGSLLCYQDLGNMDLLRSFNSPAMLKLADNRGNEYYVALTVLKETTATIIVGSEVREVSLNDVESFWLGDYVLLWRPPHGYKDVIMPGEHNRVVPWLAKHLALFEGTTLETEKTFVYNDSLVRQVKRFQLAKGLIPDGIVGAQTLIHLNTAIGNDVPTLDEKQEDT